ncbi:zinc ABC transporter ATP-binding protein ZnuC [Thioalbus denitrificans]|uniref:Zinc transport system ATP-binding protein n=1 Tax=Thioalbus denitrificans TaxID=547122 RepID=A0A369CBF6_9GAMM|nr:zinc ABC transporter ATP-binding protein ZnuC [Thioalbus denitrificans]RCX31330.1 zinc transport system ATP-binding protein [Thioalbus denitrificans]
MSTPLLEAREVVLGFAGRRVLDRVALVVNEGEIVTLIGPNGAGKSTLVRVLLGLITPDAGRVTRRPGLRVGYMPQRLAVDPVLPLTVRRFLRLAGRGIDAAALTTALREVGAEHVIDTPLQSVSGGELQRVMLARALLRKPQLLVLDEPVQGVDVTGQAELYRLIGELRARRGCGVLMVSHDLHLVMAATDHVVCLNTHVCCSGHPESVTRHPEYLRLFGPREAAALAVYTHHHDHVHDVDGHVHTVACRDRESGHG